MGEGRTPGIVGGGEAVGGTGEGDDASESAGARDKAMLRLRNAIVVVLLVSRDAAGKEIRRAPGIDKTSTSPLLDYSINHTLSLTPSTKIAPCESWPSAGCFAAECASQPVPSHLWAQTGTHHHLHDHGLYGTVPSVRNRGNRRQLVRPCGNCEKAFIPQAR